MHAICRLSLASLSEYCLKLLVNGEVLLNLGLLTRVHDYNAIYSLRLESLLDDVLKDGLVENRQEFLGHAPCCGQETRTETCRRNNSLHLLIVPSIVGNCGAKRQSHHTPAHKWIAPPSPSGRRPPDTRRLSQPPTHGVHTRGIKWPRG